MASESQRPRAPTPVVVQVVDQLADIAAVVCLTVLCARGRLSGELALIGIGAVLGVQTGLRHGLASRGTGAVGLALLALGPAASLAARTLATWGLVAVLVLVGCSTAAEVATRQTPGAPPPVGCSPVGATRCVGAMPEVCSASGRWWAALPGPCPEGCVADDAGARCVR